MRQPQCAHMVARYSSRPCRKCAAEAAAKVLAQHRDWFTRTGHCGLCGNPGNYCTCNEPCGCASLHPAGSGLNPDALETFAAAPVSADQDSLFDEGLSEVSGDV